MMIRSRFEFLTKDYIDDNTLKQIKAYIQSVTKCKEVYFDFWATIVDEEDEEVIPF